MNNNGIDVKQKKLKTEMILLAVIILLSLIAVITMLVNYQIKNYYSQDAMKIAVVDMGSLNDEMTKHFDHEDEKVKTAYLRKLMALYRFEGFLVIDSKYAYSIPEQISKVTFIDPIDLSASLKLANIDESMFNEVHK